MSHLYDARLWRIVEVPEFLMRARLSRLYREDMLAIFETMSEYLPSNPRAILDIGAGMGGIDLVLYKHFNSQPSLFLLDKDGVSQKLNAGFNPKAEDFSYYNSFTHSKLFLIEKGVLEKHLNTIDINKENFPTEQKFDLVVSLLS